VLFSSKYCLGLLCELWWSQEPGWKTLGTIIGWEALALVLLGTNNSVPSNDFPGKWGRVLEVTSSRDTPSLDGLPVHIENMSLSLDSALGEPL
jgi:hypothetical protein